MISDKFQFIVKEYGPVVDPVRVDPMYAVQFSHHLPSTLVDFWVEKGWGNYADGLLKICDPSLLVGVLNLVLDGDQDFRPEESFAYAYSAFGVLFVWNASNGAIKIDLLDNTVSAPRMFRPPKQRNPDIEVCVPLMSFENDVYDVHDDFGRPMYARAVRTLGRPGLDECFGFFPALRAGGNRDVANLKRVKSREHFAILAQLTGFDLIDRTKFPPKVVRQIG